MNTIETVTAYLPLLDEQYRKFSCSAILDTPAEFVRSVPGSAKKFKIAKIVTDGLATYSRSTGFVNGDADLTWEEREFSVDRGRALQIDSMDNLETFGLAFGRLSGEFQRDHVVPEIDAFRFAKYYTSGTKTAVTLTAANILSSIDDLDAVMDDAEVPEEGRILFISPKKYKMLVNADNITKFLNVDDGMSKALNRKIYSYNEHPIVKVPSSRFVTAITLQDGTTTGQTAGGYVKASGASDISLLLISKAAVIQLSKRNIARFWAPTRAESDANGADGVNSTADAWKFDYRVYHDAWTLDNKVAGIAGIVDAA